MAKAIAILLVLIFGVASYTVLTREPLLLDIKRFTAPALTEQKTVSTQQVTPAPAPSIPARTTWTRIELTVIHGRIVKEGQNSVTVLCEPFDDGGAGHMHDQSHAVYEWHKSPNAGLSVGEHKALVEAAISTDEKHYGPLMMFESGRWLRASANGSKSATGTVTLYGPLPAPQGERRDMINVVGAPLDDPNSRLAPAVFTTQFQVEPDKPGSWMRRSAPNPLDQRPR